MAFTTKLNLINAKFFQSSGGALDLSGTTNFGTACYLEDPVTFDPLQVPTAEWVTGQTGAINANNGLQRAGNNIVLGGSLTGVTTININNQALIISDTGGAGIEYAASYTGTYTTRSLVDKGYVTGLTSQNVSCSDFDTYTGDTDTRITNVENDVSFLGTFSGDTVADLAFISGQTDTNTADIAYISGQTGGAISGATNGLTKNGRDAELGGTLIQNTAISTDGYEFTILDTDFGYCQTASGAIALYLGDGSLATAYLTIDETNEYIEITSSDYIEIGAASGATLKLGNGGTYDNEITDNSGNGRGLTYAADYSTTFVDRSLVDKAYVDAAAGGIDAANGLSRESDNIVLGGSLTGATTIDINSQSLAFSTNPIEYSGEYSGQYDARSIPDAGYVTGITSTLLSISDFNSYSATTDVRIEDIEDDVAFLAVFSADTVADIAYISGQTGGSITGATNGLSTSGRDVKLGGDLSEDTTIVAGTNNFKIQGENTFSFIDYLANGVMRMQVRCTGATDYQAGVVMQTTPTFSRAAIRAQVMGSTCCSEIDMCHDDLTIKFRNTSGTNTFVMDGTSNLFTDALNSKGIEYAADYSSNFTDRSLVDKEYVDSQVSGGTGSLTANNGITRTGDNFHLGGALTGDTTISGSDFLEITAPFGACCASFIDLTPDPTNLPASPAQGMLYYSACTLNFVRDFPDVVLQIGEEQVVRVQNNTGGALANGDIVYISGSDGDTPEVEKSIASNDTTSRRTIGLVTNDIADSDEGFVTISGLVRDLNTTGIAAGTPVYLSATVAGAFTATKPSQSGNNILRVGYVIVGNSATEGQIFVDPCCENEWLLEIDFTGYTATTETRLSTIETDLDTVSGQTDTNTDDIAFLSGISGSTITGVTNGLTKVGSDVARLGGSLTQATTINGGQSLTLGKLEGITLRTSGTTDIGIDSQSNGGVFLKSQSGTVGTVSDFADAVGISIDFNASSGFAIYDNRAGASQTGIVYAADYSSDYVNRSLVDKAYVDSVAAGLQAKASVRVATTGNIDVTGGSFTSGSTIDGVVVIDGDRVLVKDQTDAKENGIWVFQGATDDFVRATDFDGTPSGEVANGDLVPVLTGSTNANSQWILTTPDPIDVGTDDLDFNKFSQLLELSEGNGIDIATVGGAQQISVALSPSQSGLCFDGTGLELARDIFTSGLTVSVGDVLVNASSAAIVGSEIDVKFGATNSLVVDSDDFQTVTANNGITLSGNDNLYLGGTLTGDTAIDGSSGTYDFSLNSLDSFNLGISNTSTITDSRGTPRGLEYAGDYSSTFNDNSLITKCYAESLITTGVLADNGLTKVGNTVILGGSLTGDTQIINGSSRLCFAQPGTDSISLCANNACNYVQDQGAGMFAGDGSCVGSTSINSSGVVAIATNNATTGITITDSGAGVGATYAADYSSTFVSRSLVDKGYVDGEIDATITGASNGLTKSGQDVILGGTLTALTDICTDGNRFLIGGSANNLVFFCNQENAGATGWTTQACSTSTFNARVDTFATTTTSFHRMNMQNTATNECVDFRLCEDVAQLILSDSGGSQNQFFMRQDCNSFTDAINQKGLEYGGSYEANFTDRSLVSKKYVDDCVDEQTSGITSNAITGATNGLTKSGQDALLGGTLTQNTSISTDDSYSFTIEDSSNVGLTLDSTGGVILGDTTKAAGTTPFLSFQGEVLFTSEGDVLSVVTDCFNAGNVTSGIEIVGGDGECALIDTINGGALLLGPTNKFTDNRGLTGAVGLEYDADYSSCYTPRSLVDKAYVTGQTTDIEADLAYISGVTDQNTDDITFLGVFSGDTVSDLAFISGQTDTNTTNISNNTDDITFLGVFSGDTVSDLAFISGQTDTNTSDIAALSAATISSITGATNGLTASSRVVELGGSLTKDTTIDGSFDLNLDMDAVKVAGTLSITGATTVGGTLTLDSVATGSVSTDNVLVIATDGEVKEIAASTLGEDNNRYSVTGVSNSVVNLTGDEYVVIVDTTSGAVTVNLPASPDTGTALKIKDKGNGLTNNVTVAGNGNNIDGSGNATINTDYGALELVFDGSDWFSLAFIN